MKRFLVLVIAMLSMNAMAQVAMMYKDDIPGDTLVCVTNWGPYVAALQNNTNRWNASTITNAQQSVRLTGLEGRSNVWNRGASAAAYAYSPTNPPPAQSTAFATNATYAVAVTGPQSNTLATVFGWGNHAGLYRPIDWVPSWNDVTGKPIVFTPDVHNQAWETITNPPASIATALQPIDLATNRVYTTWDTNGHWYVESGDGTKIEYWTTNVFSGVYGYTFDGRADVPWMVSGSFPLYQENDWDSGFVDGVAWFFVNGMGGWNSGSSNFPQYLIPDGSYLYYGTFTVFRVT